MFDKKWFKKHQKILVWFANTFIGKKVLRYDLDHIDAILPNAVFKREGKKVIAEFRTHNKYSKRLYYAFLPAWKLFHLWDMVWFPRFNLGFDTLTAYPDAHTESATVDGYVQRASGIESWTDLRGGAGAQSGDSDTNTFCVYLNNADGSGTGWDNMARGIFLFDTSSIPDNAIKESATFSLYVTSVSDNFSQKIGIVTSTPASNTALANGDYGNLATTRQATDIDLTDLNTSAYNDFTLNATGLASISLTSITKFGTRMSGDIDNSEPSGATATAQVVIYFADQTGTSTDPKLVVTYSVPGFLAMLS